MKTLDKERRRKRHMEKGNGSGLAGPPGSASGAVGAVDQAKPTSAPHRKPSSSTSSLAGSSAHGGTADSNDKIKREKCENSSSNIQTEIRTDDFVVRLLLFNFLLLFSFKLYLNKKNNK
uniref:Uncharacterized protein n=1 Tax=Anopheles melas TaxID=34690 RepID=A0A182U6I5_9DIPT